MKIDNWFYGISLSIWVTSWITKQFMDDNKGKEDCKTISKLRTQPCYTCTMLVGASMTEISTSSTAAVPVTGNSTWPIRVVNEIKFIFYSRNYGIFFILQSENRRQWIWEHKSSEMGKRTNILFQKTRHYKLKQKSEYVSLQWMQS